MSSGAQKFFGWILFCAGFICIIFAVYSAYQVFTGALEPPAIFKMQSISLSIPSQAGAPAIETKILLQKDAQKIMDMILYYVFMFFIASVGAKVSSLGILFIKEIKVKS